MVDISMAASQDGVLITQQFVNMITQKRYRLKTSAHSKKGENFISHHNFFADNFFRVNCLALFSISAPISAFFLYQKRIFAKDFFLLIIALFANFESQSRTKRLKNTGRRLL
jgi:hypothetical protein